MSLRVALNIVSVALKAKAKAIIFGLDTPRELGPLHH